MDVPQVRGGHSVPRERFVALAIPWLPSSGEFRVGVRQRIPEATRGGNQSSGTQKVLWVAQQGLFILISLGPGYDINMIYD